jgi:hypothetical protein
MRSRHSSMLVPPGIGEGVAQLRPVELGSMAIVEVGPGEPLPPPVGVPKIEFKVDCICAAAD